MDSKSVLVIDDEPAVLQLLERVLEAEGYNVSIAIDGASGMARYAENQPDMVLLDIMMPGLDGYQVLESIRQDSDVPVVIITGKDSQESLQQVMALGADGLVQKPFPPLEIVGQVQEKMRL
jgi:two-component system response regulator MtrA